MNSVWLSVAIGRMIVEHIKKRCGSGLFHWKKIGKLIYDYIIKQDFNG